MLGRLIRTKGGNATHGRVISQWIATERGERLGVLDELEQVAPRLGVRVSSLAQCVDPSGGRDVVE